jgi:hypothetical protein
MTHHRNAPLALPLGRRAGWFAALLLAILAMAAWTDLAGRAAAEEAAPPGRAALPPELALVPRDAPGVISIRVADVWNSDAAAPWRKMIKDEPDLAMMQMFLEKALGLSVTDLDRAVLIIPPPDSHVQPIFVIRTGKPFDKDKVLGALVPGAKEEKVGGMSYFPKPNGRDALAVVNERVFLVGPAKELREFLERPAEKKADGPLSDALTRAAGKNQIVVGLNGPAVAKEMKKDLPPPLAPLAEAQSATLTINAGKELVAHARASFATEEAAKEGEKAAEAGLELARKSIPMLIEKIEKEPTNKEFEKTLQAKMVRSLKDTEKALKSAKAERKGSVVEGTLRVETPDTISMLFLFLMPRGAAKPPSPPPPVDKPSKDGR